GEGIVLGHDGDRGARSAARNGGPERGGQATHAPLDLRTLTLEEFREPGGRLLLLEAEFGIGVDAVAQTLQVVGESIDRLRDLRLGVIEAPVCNRHASLTLPS